MSLYAVTYEYVDDESRLAALRPGRYAYFQELEASGHPLAGRARAAAH